MKQKGITNDERKRKNLRDKKETEDMKYKSSEENRKKRGLN